ncbi:serine hydrolase domain-containing protein [Kordiimonas marina]|uniref:serine hydrolase domain-containing protein n=1 Tax=Kordiimonas marina TaxID=2872312 RepID=UPI001FF1C3EF
MKQILKAVCAVVLIMFGGLGALQAQEPEKAAQSFGGYKDLDVFVDTMVATQRSLLDISAMTVSIVKDGKLIFSKAYGTQDIDRHIPATADKSTFRIGSTSKLFTWTAVMQQVERGNLDLDTDVNKYLKTFQIPATFKEPITLRHILTHTAGFEDGALGYLINYDPKTSLPLQAAMAKYIPKRVNKPGAYSSYSNYAVALAGLIVQNVSGVPFADYIRQNIFAPLGMNHSTFREPLPDALMGGRTVGYARKMGGEEAQPFEIISSFAPAGSMSSTADDMAKFMIMHLNNGRFGDVRLLKEATAKQMHSVLFQADKRLPGMAHGFYEEYLNGHRLIGHGGDTMQFHTNLMLDEAEHLGIFVSYATETGRHGRDQFIKSFYDHYYPMPLKQITPPADFNSRAEAYAGEYKFWRRNFSTIEKAGGILGGSVTVAPTGKNTLMIGGVFEPRQYVEVGKDLFRQVDGTRTLAFGRNADGKVQDLYFDFLPFMALSRAPAFEGKLFTLVLPLVCILILLSVFTGWIYRRKDYRAMDGTDRMAIRFSMAAAGVNLLYLIALGVIVASYGETLYEGIPTIFAVNQTLTLVAVLMMLGVVWCAVRVWRRGRWTMGRRIHYSLVALAAVYLSLFYYYWNMLGWQYF